MDAGLKGTLKAKVVRKKADGSSEKGEVVMEGGNVILVNEDNECVGFVRNLRLIHTIWQLILIAGVRAYKFFSGIYTYCTRLYESPSTSWTQRYIRLSMGDRQVLSACARPQSWCSWIAHLFGPASPQRKTLRARNLRQ